MTAKEAFNDIAHELRQRHMDMYADCDKEIISLVIDEMNKRETIVDQALDELEELKRYPTADEVCKALSEYYHYEVEYSKKDMTFESELSWYACFKDGIIDFGGDKLPPHLVTLIGRFYEGLENKNTSK